MNPQDSMRDWPRSLKLNHEAIKLAPVLYIAACAIYGGIPDEFQRLLPRVRQRFIEDAAEVLAHDRRVDRTPLQFIKPPAHVAPSQPYIRTRGLMPRCCKDSIECERHLLRTEDRDCVTFCRHCGKDLIFRDGAWEQKA